jgi:hypothetical protein
MTVKCHILWDAHCTCVAQLLVWSPGERVVGRFESEDLKFKSTNGKLPREDGTYTRNVVYKEVL